MDLEAELKAIIAEPSSVEQNATCINKYNALKNPSLIFMMKLRNTLNYLVKFKTMKNNVKIKISQIYLKKQRQNYYKSKTNFSNKILVKCP